MRSLLSERLFLAMTIYTEQFKTILDLWHPISIETRENNRSSYRVSQYSCVSYDNAIECVYFESINVIYKCHLFIMKVIRFFAVRWRKKITFVWKIKQFNLVTSSIWNGFFSAREKGKKLNNDIIVRVVHWQIDKVGQFFAKILNENNDNQKYKQEKHTKRRAKQTNQHIVDCSNISLKKKTMGTFTVSIKWNVSQLLLFTWDRSFHYFGMSNLRRPKHVS